MIFARNKVTPANIMIRTQVPNQNQVPHTPPQVDWKEVPSKQDVGHGIYPGGQGGPSAMSFTYIAPTVKHSCAFMATSTTVYKSGRAYQAGNQPYNWHDNVHVAHSSPAIPRLTVNQHGKNRIQSSAQDRQSQIVLARLLSGQSQVGW